MYLISSLSSSLTVQYRLYVLCQYHLSRSLRPFFYGLISPLIISSGLFLSWEHSVCTCRPAPIMLKNLPIMLCCTAPKKYLLCSIIIPIMLEL